MKKIIALLLTAVMMLSLAACGAKNEAPAASVETAAPAAGTEAAEGTPETRMITDIRGREVEIPYEVNAIVCLGSGAPRIAAYLQGPINGIILVDCFILRKRKLSLKSAFFLEGHDAYKYPGGFNIIGVIAIVVGLACGLMVYNPMFGTVNSPIFYVTTGSGFTLITGGLTYLILTLTPWGRRYSLRDRNDLEIV